MDKPIYELKINEEQGSFVGAIALVDSPAIESDFLAFNQQVELKFEMNDERMELLGPAMIPDQLIFRKGIPEKRIPDYQVFFSSETIRQIAQVYMKHGFQNNLNVEHDSKVDAKSFVYQSYIVDSKFGMNSPVGMELPDGSWVVGVKVTDASVWQDIKAGKRNGFSVEGVFQLIPHEFNTNLIKGTPEEIVSEIFGMLDKIN